MMDVNGDPDGPPTRVGVFVGDLATPLYESFSILAAFRHRDQNRRRPVFGRLDDGYPGDLNAYGADGGNSSARTTGRRWQQCADRSDRPLSTKRRQYHYHPGEYERWKRLCGAFDADDTFNDPRYATSVDRAACIADVRAAIQAKFSHLNVAEAVEKLENADVPVAPVRTLSQVAEDLHFQERGTLKPMRHQALETTVEGGIVPDFPVKFSSGPLPQPRGGVSLGYDNDDVYGRLLGLDRAAIATLQRKGSFYARSESPDLLRFERSATVQLAYLQGLAR